MSSCVLQDMEMEAFSHILKQSTHSVIKWNIKHFCLLNLKEYSIKSPEFCIHSPQFTKWRLNFTFKCKEILSVDLELLDFQPSFKDIVIDCKVCLIYQNENFIKEYTGRFYKDSRIWSIGWYELKDILNRLKVCKFEEDELNLECQLCARLELVNMRDNSDDVLSLSQDLTRLYTENKNCDIELKVHDDHIHAHKAILISRNIRLANHINKNQGKEVIELPGVDYEIMKAIVEYFYSGSVQPLLYKPPVLVHKCAYLFNISELFTRAFSNQMTFSKSIKVQEFTHTCHISDLISGKKIRRIHSLTDGISDITLQFQLSQVEAQGINFNFEITGGPKEQGICIEFGIFDAEQNIIPPRRKYFLLKAQEFNFDETVDKNDMSIFSTVHGDLRIHVKIQMTHYEETQMTPSRDSFKILICKNCQEKLYNSFSNDMKSLFENCTYSDIKVKAKKKSFKVHKSILSARSLFFSQQINAVDENNEIKVSNISDLVFRYVLLYIYSGTLGTDNVANTQLVYEAALELRMHNLKDACFRSLKRNIKEENVDDIFEFADRMKDTDLKDSAMRFAKRNSRQVVKADAWKY